MLQKIHEKVHGVIAWVMIIFIAVTFTLWGINYYLDAHVHDNATVVATVNGEKIYTDAFNQAYERQKQEQASRLGTSFTITPYLAQQLKQDTLKLLTLNQVLLQAAKAAGFSISIQQAETALSFYPQFQEDGKFSTQKFNQVLSAIALTPHTFLEQMQNGMLINQQHFALVASAFVLPSDVHTLVKLSNQTRDYHYLVIKAQAFKDKVVVSEAQLQDYYQKNKAHFTTPEQVSVQYIELSVPQLIAQLKISDQELTNYYHDNIDNYIKPAEYQLAHILIRLPATATASQTAAAAKKAAQVLQQLQQGKPFTALAKQYSDDTLSAMQGGIMPTVTLGTLGSDFDAAIVQLKQPGQLSQAIKTKYGYEILNLISLTPASQLSFASVKEQIASTLKNDKAQQLFSQNSDELTNITYQNPDSLQPAAQQLHLPIQETALFSTSGLTTSIASNNKIIQAAFSDEVLAQKNNSQPIQINDNTLIVLRVKQHLPKKIIAFEQMKAKISEWLITQQAQQLAAAFGKTLINAMKAHQPVTKMLAQINSSWEKVTHAKRNTNAANAINQFAFTLARPLAGQLAPMGSFTQANGDYVIVALTLLTDGNLTDVSAAQRKIFSKQMTTATGITDYDLYAQNLVKQAKVVNYMTAAATTH